MSEYIYEWILVVKLQVVFLVFSLMFHNLNLPCLAQPYTFFNGERENQLLLVKFLHVAHVSNIPPRVYYILHMPTS